MEHIHTMAYRRDIKAQDRYIKAIAFLLPYVSPAQLYQPFSMLYKLFIQIFK